jgi:hypothetical protein
MEENMSPVVLALYAAFAGFLLILGIANKLWIDRQENRKAPRFQFPKEKKQSKKEVQEERTLVASR